MFIILNLEKVVKVKDLKEAKRWHSEYWKELSWISPSERWDSVILEARSFRKVVPIGYLSQNGRLWDWNDSETILENGPAFSNPFTNGSSQDNKYNKFMDRTSYLFAHLEGEGDFFEELEDK